MKIKKLTKENKKIFQLTYVSALREGFLDFCPTKMIEEFDKNFDDYLEECYNNLMHMYLCYENQTPIGVICFGESNLKDKEVGDAEIESLYFRKFAHGKGYAKKLLDFAENILENEGYVRICLWCSKENSRAWSFYLKNGFKPIERYWDDTLDGKVFHNVLLVKNI